MINYMQRQKDCRTSVQSFVECVDTTRIENWVFCCVHHSEGFCQCMFKVGILSQLDGLCILEVGSLSLTVGRVGRRRKSCALYI
jgi:hypothetical protein